MIRFTIRDVLWLTVVVPALLSGCSGRPSVPANSPATAQDEMLRKTKWNVQVLFHMDEMERAGRSAEEVDKYREQNYDKPPKDFKFDD
jgi:hypothetical protein